MRQRTALSGGWWLITALIAIYFILASVNSKNVQNVHGLDKNTRGFDTAVVGSTMTVAVLGVLYAALTGFNLLGRWCSAETDAGAWYGVSVASAFFLCGNFIQSGLVARGYYDKAVMMQPTQWWSLTDTNFLRGVYVLSFLLAVFLFLYGWLLLLCKKAFGPQYPQAPMYPPDQYSDHVHSDV